MKRSTLRRFLLFLLPYGHLISSAGLLLLISSAISLVFPLLVREMFNNFVYIKDVTLLKKTVGWGFLLLAVQAGVNYLANLNFAFLGAQVSTNMRIKLFDHIQKTSFRFLQRTQTGDVVSRLMNDVGRVQTLLTSEIGNLIQEPILVLGAFVMMFRINPTLSLFLVLFLLLVVMVAKPLGEIVKAKSRLVQERLGEMTSLVQDVLSGIFIVKSFLLEGYTLGKLKEVSGEFIRSTLVSAKYRSLMASLIQFVALVPFFGILGYSGYLVMKGAITQGDLVAFMWYMLLLVIPLGILSNAWANFQSALGACERIFQALDEPQEKEREKGLKELRTVRGHIIFDKVSFSYEGGVEALKDVSFEIKAGEKVAIVGHTGAGKSTLVALLLRFYEPTEGKIYIDGQDITTIKPSSLRKFIAVVPQETILFSGTVRENIAVGKLHAREEEIIQAAKMAEAHDFISKLPQGYETPLGERGSHLSGGERQRIALARAFLRDAPILILDEATSALDAETETKLQMAMKRLFQGKTVIIIAHRLSTVRLADKIIVLENGRVVECGSHEELLRSNKLYAKFYVFQLQGEMEGKEVRTDVGHD